MRKITEIAVQNFNNCNDFKQANTEVINDNEKTGLYLHNNLIAYKDRDKNNLYIDCCGWLTNTTKERLNALQGVSIRVKKGVWYLNDREWNGKKINVY